MKNAETVYVKVGKIGSTYGVQGWLKIQSYTEFGASILDYRPWYLTGAPHERILIEVEDGRIHGNGIIAKFAGINTPEDARLLTGKIIEIDRSQLPVLPKNEFYWSDLEGLTVIDQNGGVLGKVSYLMATGSNDVLVIKGDKEHAIPYLPGSVVMSVDLDKREIHVNWELI
jgi:16S rRNA processing protein RimM